MLEHGLLWIAGCGVALFGGVFVVLYAMLPRPIRLGDALAQLDATPASLPLQASLGGTDSLLERLGAAAYLRLRLPLSATSTRLLALQGRSIADFFAEKLVLASLGAFVPVLLWALGTLAGRPFGMLPFAVAVLGAVLGFLVPDLQLRRRQQRVNTDAAEMLTTFLDLVTLARLSNQSATQALHAAAEVSEAPLFVRMRTTLEHARLQQRPPWADLRRLGTELQLPQLGDIADILQLDEQGASLADALRARVKELRQAELMHHKMAAQAVSERMTVVMVGPTLVFAAFFLTPPLLRIAGLA